MILFIFFFFVWYEGMYIFIRVLFVNNFLIIEGFYVFFFFEKFFIVWLFKYLVIVFNECFFILSLKISLIVFILLGFGIKVVFLLFKESYFGQDVVIIVFDFSVFCCFFFYDNLIWFDFILFFLFVFCVISMVFINEYGLFKELIL